MGIANAKWIWNDPEGAGRNRYVLFRRTFELAGNPTAGRLSLFADTRYRLLVNGVVLGHGPARFFVCKPEYDTYDLLPVLRRGRNVIAVVVNSCGCVTFHSEKSVGGLIAWGEACDETGHTVDLATDESWRAIESPGHRPDTPYLSFALNPGEFLDARAMPVGWESADFDDTDWPHAIIHADPDHWGPLHPRSIPMLDERKVHPVRRLGTWVARLAPDEDVYSLIAIAEGGNSLHTQARVAVMTYIHSPRDQQITFGAWWGRYWVNGEPLRPIPRMDVSLRQDFTATLRQGWNTLFVYETVKFDWWDFYLVLPTDAGLEVSAERQIGSPHTFLVGGLWEDELAEQADRMELPLERPEDLPEKLGPWKPWPRGKSADTPCRERAWKTFERISDDDSLLVDGSELASRVGDGTLSVLFDFGGEVLGRPTLHFTAAAGTVMDLTYTERLKEDGTADVHRRFFVDMAERYIAREGRQTWQTFHPRGFRYLEVLVQGSLDAFQLHEVSLTRANYPVEDIGEFECSDPVLNEVWKVGRTTLAACMADAYLDCPSRERGLYTGDFFVEFFINLATYGDAKLFRRCIELFLLGQGENGLIPPGAHGLPPGRHPDYSAILVQAIWRYWAQTGDVDFLWEISPCVTGLLLGLDALTVEGRELIDGSALHPYIDTARVERTGLSCALNCFCQRAYADGACILDLAGDAQGATFWAGRAEALAEAIRREFWDQERGVFVDRLLSAAADANPSVAGNALALLYDIADDEQAERAVEWLVQAMLENFRVPEPQELRDCNVSSYHSFYALGALYKHGRALEAEQFIRKYWGRMLERGAWTCWEYFIDTGSRCHAWSGCPTFYLSSQVLGVGFPEPGNPNVVSIRPQPGRLEWARGVWPHPAGPIRVAWERKGEDLVLDYDCPDAVRVITDVRRSSELLPREER